jgi:hypothetical protein
MNVVDDNLNPSTNNSNAASGISSASSKKSNFLDPWDTFFFPFVTETHILQHVSAILRVFSYFFILMQILFGSLFQFRTHLNSSAFKIILQFFFFGFAGDVVDFFPFFIALIILDIATFASLVAFIIHCRLTHEYNRATCFIIAYWHGYFFNLFLIPNLMLPSLAFAYLGELGTTMSYITTILSLVVTLYNFVHYTRITPSLMRSPYLSPSPIHAWDPAEVISCGITFGILFGLFGLFHRFIVTFEFLPPIGVCFLAVLNI